MHQPITIIGAGIGGLTIALALKQKGFPVIIYESSKEIKPVGTGIVLAGNAMQVFQNLGLREKIESVGNRIFLLKMTNEKLNVLSEVPLSKPEKKYGVFNIAIHRADLQRILAEEVGYENIHLGKRLINIRNGETITGTFEDNSILHSRVVIGADGIHSTVRNQLFAPSVIRDANQVCWRGVLTTELAEKYPNEAYEAWGRGKRFGFVRISTNKLYWFAVVNKGMYKNSNLAELFREFHPDILKIISDTGEDKIYRNNLIDLKPFGGWHQGNVCLMGDAAHATTPNLGQGACQAVEDAWIIGELISSGKVFLEIFAEYEKIRKKKAHFIVNTSWRMGKLVHIDHVFFVLLRNFFMKMIPNSLSLKQIESIFNLDYFGRK